MNNNKSHFLPSGVVVKNIIASQRNYRKNVSMGTYAMWFLVLLLNLFTIADPDMQTVI